MNYRTLVSRAKAAKRHSHSPYSRFRVGAAVLAASGKIYSGCNIENSSYGLTVCAERTALFKAVSEGESSFVALAIASDERTATPPCGACRQVIMDLAGDIDVVLSARDGTSTVLKSTELLPHPFGGKNLKNVQRRKR
jgi:cytidine deaminase